MKRFSKGWDVFFNPSDSTKKLIDLSYQDVTFYYDTSSKFVVAPNTWRMIKLEGNPLKSRTYQEAWAHLTYDVYKELGHNDEQGYVAR